MIARTLPALAAGLLLVAAAGAHPFHESFAEAHFNPAADTIEVALRVDAAELEQRLRAGQAGRFPAEGPARDALRADYVRARFAARRGDRPLPLQWVGAEYDGAFLWMYFELSDCAPRPGEPAVLHVRNTLLLETSARQVNTVTFVSGRQRATLRFAAGLPPEVPLTLSLPRRPDPLAIAVALAFQLAP